jgi:hypothetical protein
MNKTNIKTFTNKEIIEKLKLNDNLPFFLRFTGLLEKDFEKEKLDIFYKEFVLSQKKIEEKYQKLFPINSFEELFNELKKLYQETSKFIIKDKKTSIYNVDKIIFINDESLRPVSYQIKLLKDEYKIYVSDDRYFHSNDFNLYPKPTKDPQKIYNVIKAIKEMEEL